MQARAHLEGSGTVFRLCPRAGNGERRVRRGAGLIAVGASVGEGARRGRLGGSRETGGLGRWRWLKRGDPGARAHISGPLNKFYPHSDSPQPEQGQVPPSPLPNLSLTLGSVLGQLSLLLARIPLGGFSENPSPLKPSQCPHPHPGHLLPRSCK